MAITVARRLLGPRVDDFQLQMMEALADVRELASGSEQTRLAPGAVQMMMTQEVQEDRPAGLNF